jgi:UDP-glucose 4-epimerase
LQRNGPFDLSHGALMTIMITGGAGYIGSHMVYGALDRDENVLVIDDLSTGIAALVPPQAHFCRGDIGDVILVRNLIREYSVTAVIHFAGSVVVPDSVKNPLFYYSNNTTKSRSLIEICVEEGISQFVFSSTAAVYGVPDRNPVDEAAPALPINPYGCSKLMTEWILRDTAYAHGLNFVNLRYFNVAGADPAGRSGQSTPRATHLIKRACQVGLGRLAELEIFGTDYPTADGTGVRDYIHVTDLIQAHILALDYLRNGGKSITLNCGYGHGFSVLQVIKAVSRAAGREIPIRETSRRPGDAPEIIADSSSLRRHLSWKPQYDDLDAIVSMSYAWERRLVAPQEAAGAD